MTGIPSTVTECVSAIYNRAKRLTDSEFAIHKLQAIVIVNAIESGRKAGLKDTAILLTLATEVALIDYSQV